MIFTTVQNVVDNVTTYTKAIWDAQFRDNINNLLKPPMAAAYRSTVQSVSRGNTVAVSFDAVRYDTDSPAMWAAGQPTRLTVQTAGIFLVSGYLAFQTLTTGTARITIGFRLNGTTTFGKIEPPAHGTGIDMPRAASAQKKLAVGDYIELMCGYESTDADATRNILASGTNSPAELQLTWQGRDT